MYTKIRKSLLAFAIVLAGIFAFTTPVQFAASSSVVESIDITVDLQKDGSAHIQQVWQTDNKQGTEYYFDLNAGHMDIKNYSVHDETGRTFENIGEWDIDASFDQKAYKNGLVDLGGNHYEVAWGMGDMGRHTYTLNYTLTNFISSYSDYDGFNQRLINDDMATPPRKVNLRIQSDGEFLNGDNTGIWGFGYRGDIVFDGNGAITAQSFDAFSSRNHLTVMVRFDKGVFAPTYTDNRSFSDIANDAFVGSDYSYDEYDASGGDTSYSESQNNTEVDGKIIAGIFAAVVGFFVLLIGAIGAGVHYNNKIGPSKKKYGITKNELENPEGLYREITFEGDIADTTWALREVQIAVKDGDILGAYVLRMVYKGYIKISSRMEKGFLGSSEKTTIELLNEPAPDEDKQLKDLYEMFEEASLKNGEVNTNGNFILPEKVFTKWVQKNTSRIGTWNSTLGLRGLTSLKNKGYLVSSKSSGIFATQTNTLTEPGLQELKYTLALKKFLEEYSLISERFPNEVHLWEDYLVYASIFGIADQVAKDLKHMFPQEFEQFEARYSYMDTYMTLYLVRSFSTTTTTTYTTATSTSSSGGGGFSSMGGGGGFSGGGSGGGAR